MVKEGSSDYKNVRTRWFFKEPFTQWFFVEPKNVLLWHRCEEPFISKSVPLTILPSWVTNVSECVCVCGFHWNTYVTLPVSELFFYRIRQRPHVVLGMLRTAGSGHGLDLPLSQTKTFSLFFLLEWLYFLPLMHACSSQREELELRFPRTPYRREVWKWPKCLSALNKHQHVHV